MKRCTFLLVVSLSFAAQARFQDDYWIALEALNDAEYELATESFQSAISKNPDSQERIRVFGMRFEPYVPYYYLGRARYALGDCDGAAEAFSQELAQGVIQGLTEMAAAHQALAACQGLPPTALSQQDSDPETRPVTPGFRQYYRLALNHLAQGEASLAITALDAAIADNPHPQETIRLFGMRFEPYLPYFHLAAARMSVGDCPKAMNAWQIAIERGVVQTQSMTTGFGQAIRLCQHQPSRSLAQPEPASD